MKIPEQITPSNEDPVSAGKLNRFRLDENGREICDSRPMEPPVGYEKRESVTDQIRRMIQQAAKEVEAAGAESLEEANDFYISDDPGSELPPSIYEFDEDYELEQQLARQKAQEAPVPPDPDPEPIQKAPTKKAAKPAPEPLGGEGDE
ncbi:MAG: hypothetical protein [Arizlama microvirus]|nr:MAG: hypothetical protein [Arizlama microvirus]